MLSDQSSGKQRSFGFDSLIGNSPAIVEVRKRAERIAALDVPVIITGESGTGKELVAQGLHYGSRRASGRFVCVNCAAVSRDLFESEFFGHEQGAFTGAHSRRKGYFEMAHYGTLFLDECGELPVPLQPKLLRVIASGEILRVGATTPVSIDVRIIAATNRDLEAMAQLGEFRGDLLHRLDVARIHLPPLRNRREDIEPLFNHFLAETFAKHGLQPPQPSRHVISQLIRYDWPGNVRELRNVAQKVLVEGCHSRSVDRLPHEFEAKQPSDGDERRRIEDALQRRRYVARAAEELGCSRQQLYRRMKKLGIANEGAILE